MNKKTIHALVTSLSYKAGFESPQKFYRTIYSKLHINNKTKGSRLSTVMKESRLNDFLAEALSLSKKPIMLNNKLTPAEPFVHKINGIRHYQFDNNNYPSVTTILKHGQEKQQDFFKKWEERLITEYGEKIGRRKKEISSTIGDYVHLTLEAYLKGGMVDKNIINRNLAKHLIPFLDQIDEVLGIELPIFSERGYAGRVDCIARMKDGTHHIIDFKTSKSARTNSNCKDYRAQSAAYALAVYEMFGLKVDAITLAVVYKSVIGKRNPRRYDILTTTDIRPHLELFLERLEAFNSKKEELGMEVAF